MLRKSWLFTRDSGSIYFAYLMLQLVIFVSKWLVMYFKLNPDNKAPLDSINMNAMKRKKKI